LIAPLPVEQLVYVDETGIDHNIRLVRGWAPRGQRLYGEKPGNRTGRTSAIAALCGRKLHSPFCFEGYCTADVFNTWVEHSLVPNLKPGQIVILDNARFHQSKRTQALIKAAACKLLFLPPYSPDLNNIEHTWSPLKHHYAKIQHRYPSPADAVDAAFQYMIQ
jgi:transposase